MAALAAAYREAEEGHRHRHCPGCGGVGCSQPRLEVPHLRCCCCLARCHVGVPSSWQCLAGARCCLCCHPCCPAPRLPARHAGGDDDAGAAAAAAAAAVRPYLGFRKAAVHVACHVHLAALLLLLRVGRQLAWGTPAYLAACRGGLVCCAGHLPRGGACGWACCCCCWEGCAPPCHGCSCARHAAPCSSIAMTNPMTSSGQAVVKQSAAGSSCSKAAHTS
jgi:hypothetical protein